MTTSVSAASWSCALRITDPLRGITWYSKALYVICRAQRKRPPRLKPLFSTAPVIPAEAPTRASQQKAPPAAQGARLGRDEAGRAYCRVLVSARAVIVQAAMWLLASILCFTLLQAHIDCMHVVGIVGENFTFPVQIDQKVVEPVWKKNKDIVAEWEERNKPTYFDPLRNRSVLMENGSLTIFNLEKDDAGTYMLQYWDSVKDHYLDFELDVLDSLPEPNISCSTSDDELVLNCTACFQGSLSYTWKLSNKPHSYQNQELSIPLKHVGTTTKATCIIKFSQTGRSSEISLIQCLPEEKGDRSRGSLIGAFVLTAIILVGLLIFLCRKGTNKLGTGRRTAHVNNPVNGSGEHEQLFSENSQQQPNSKGAAFSHAVHDENEEPKEEE
ncbi:lymphocyte function-associated antigen 3 isoform X4 [Oenanthe melanoleuca]|uniref:lymphocyte function-associated antigen 3 isoform X4 n=1 Tax=Oenanthe melanoleuca TaxID=2939378 RepID=UPI0024C20619|nr:lymphocyte function-associated antigen 3 isoform X4 [Oenanthe melanoleuca]